MLENLNSFLKLGYFLDYKNKSIDIDLSNIDKDRYKDAKLDELISIWRRCFKWNKMSEKSF